MKIMARKELSLISHSISNISLFFQNDKLSYSFIKQMGINGLGDDNRYLDYILTRLE